MSSSEECDELKLYSEIMKSEPVPDILPLIELLSDSKFKIRRNGKGKVIAPLSLRIGCSF